MPERLQKLIRRVQNLSYKRKLLLTCLTVSILPLSITTVFCVSQMTSSLLRQEDTEEQQLGLLDDSGGPV